MPKTIHLTNAVELSKEFKMRKPPPTLQQISFLTPDDYVKLEANSEYFWVKVDEVNPFVGLVQDPPVFPQKFTVGDKIYFEDFNIFDLRAKEWLNSDGI
jgi:hypothetical protein